MISFRGNRFFLSNFYPLPDGKTLEHYYQAAKVAPGPHVWKQRILQARTPGEARRLGRLAPIRPDWDNVKIAVMRDLVLKKFAAGSDLAEKLLATGNEDLVEENNWGDRFWGRCDGRGENWLGRLLMERRRELRSRVRRRGLL